MGKGMKAGKKPGVKKNNQMAQMQQIQAMQRRMEDAQSAIEVMETEASAGGGAVTVKVNGKHELVGVTLKPEIVDPDDIEMLQDLVMAAVNEALRKGEEARETAMNRMAPGMGGLF